MIITPPPDLRRSFSRCRSIRMTFRQKLALSTSKANQWPGDADSIPRNHFIQIQHHSANGRPRRQFRYIQARWNRRYADARQLLCVFDIRFVIDALLRQEAFRDARSFGLIGRSRASSKIFCNRTSSALSPLFKILAANDPGGFDEAGIVQERQCLLGRVGDVAIGGAFFAAWGVEVGEHRVHEGPLPVHVEAAAELAVVGFGIVVAVGELDVDVITRRLIGVDAGAADIEGDETGDGEGVVADEFGFESAGVLAGERRLFGSISRSSGRGLEDWRYVADMTINLTMCLMSQVSRNSTASQSSRSGCVGGSPCVPRSSTTAERALP